jgi:carboxymethylenebutenolidase
MDDDVAVRGQTMGAIMGMKTVASGHDGFALPCWFAPAVGARRGGVVVAQEIFGITDHIREVCARFAAQGYDALAPSLYERVEAGFHAGHDAQGIAKGLKAVEATPFKQVAADMQACIDALEGPVFATGFCYGGAVTWLAAQRCTGLAAASGFYGRLINRLLDAPPKAPIILHYGRNDAGIPLSEVDKVRAAYPDVPVYLYDAGHGFCREASGDFDAPSRDLAFTRTFDFFAAHGART